MSLSRSIRCQHGDVIFYSCRTWGPKPPCKYNLQRESGCGLVGRVVASYTRGQWFESSHQQNFEINIFTVTVEKTKMRKKIPPFQKRSQQHNWILPLNLLISLKVFTGLDDRATALIFSYNLYLKYRPQTCDVTKICHCPHLCRCAYVLPC